MKYVFFVLFTGFSLLCRAQYPSLISHYHYFKMNALCEDTLSDKVYVQTTGMYMPARSAAELTAFNLAPLSTGSVINTYTYTPAAGSSLYYARQLEPGNNKIYVNDTAIVRAVDPATGNIFWNYIFNGGTCHSMNLKGNSLVVIYDSLNSYYDIRIDKINTGTGAITSACKWTSSLYGPGGPFLYLLSVRAAKILNNKLYFGGEFQVSDSLGNTLTNFAVFDLVTGRILPYDAALNGLVNDIEIFNNKLYLAGTFTSSSFYARSRFAVFDTSLNLLPTTISFNREVDAIGLYNTTLFALGRFSKINSTVVNPTFNYVMKAIDLNTGAVKSWNMNAVDPLVYNSGPDTSTSNRNLKVVRNRLYLSGFAGGPQQLDEYCLPPKMYGSISGPPQVCIPSAGPVTYSIAPALYAGSYNWSYSGAGVTLTFTNNIAHITYSTSSTPGTLKVFTKAICGTNSDTLFLPISLNPRPVVSASASKDTLSCFSRKVKLSGNAAGPVYYSWSGPCGYSSGLQSDSSAYNCPGNYSLTVSFAITGCASNTVITIKTDTIKPSLSLPSSPVNIVCSPDSSVLNGSSTTSPSLIWWHSAGGGTNHSNPWYTKSPGNYYMVVQNTHNGCRDSSLFPVGFKGLLPNIKLLSHPMPMGLNPIDSLSCSQPSVTVSGGSDTANTVVSWRAVPGGTLFSNPITVTSQGNFRLIAQRSDNGCADSSLIIYIKQDKTPPALSVLTPNAAVNCSSATATLNAIGSVSTTVLQWSGPGGFVSSNPAVTAVLGLYYITAINPANGCSKKDSVMVGYNPLIVIDAGRDTTICPNSPLNLSATASGTLTGINYSWSSGGNGPAINVNPAVSTLYIVSASAGGCTGTDTLKVTVPPALADSVVTTKSCGSNNAGSLNVFVKGGVAPYQFSLNGNPYSNQSSFNSLAYGSYNIGIRDALGCSLTTSATISQNSSLPQPVFIASTKNSKGDTLVLVDLTVPKPDSVEWTLPAGAVKIGGDMFDPIVVFADTGSFPVTLKAFYQSCVINATKLIHVRAFDSTLATQNNNNGIKSISLFPNPSNGLFTVNVEFCKKQYASIQVRDALSVKYLQQDYGATDSISLPLSLINLPNGAYILQVIGEYDARFVNFVISR